MVAKSIQLYTRRLGVGVHALGQLLMDYMALVYTNQPNCPNLWR